MAAHETNINVESTFAAIHAPATMTTYLDAAYHILQLAGQSLRYEDITERALAQQLISTQGLTPEATMASHLCTDMPQEGSRFTRAGKGAFGIVAQTAGREYNVQRQHE